MESVLNFLNGLKDKLTSEIDSLSLILIIACGLFCVCSVLLAGFVLLKDGEKTVKLSEASLAATKAQAVAVLDEAPVAYPLKDEALRIKTEKMGALKPRLDDKINFTCAESVVESLSALPLTDLERASLSRAMRVIKHCKNTEMTDVSRCSLNAAFEEVVRLSAKRKRC